MILSLRDSVTVLRCTALYTAVCKTFVYLEHIQVLVLSADRKLANQRAEGILIRWFTEVH